MQVAAISCVRNEADIVESFVRFTLQMADHMWIIEHRSDDATPQILKALRDEGLPLTVIHSDELAYEQGVAMTAYMHKVARAHEPSVVLPLDADEFLTTEAGVPSREELVEAVRQGPRIVPWRTYVPTVEDDSDDPCPPRRIHHHRDPEPETFHKVIVPGSLAARADVFLENGSHALSRSTRAGSEPFEADSISGMTLSHFPLRTIDQAMKKVLLGWTANVLRADRKAGESYHLARMFRKLTATSPSQIDLTKLALEYTRPDGSEAPPTSLVRRPLSGCGDIRLRYSHLVRPIDLILRLAEECERLAGELGRTRATLKELRRRDYAPAQRGVSAIGPRSGILNRLRRHFAGCRWFLQRLAQSLRSDARH